MKYIKRICLDSVLLTAVAFSFHGCAGKVASHEEAVATIKGQAVEKNVPKNFAAMAETGEVDDGWLKSFNDTTLNRLVAEALTGNPGLKIAQAKVDQAKALTRQAEANLKPTLGHSADYKERNTEGFNNIGSVGVGASWEADVWGRIRTGVAGDTESAEATSSDFQFARQSLVAATANAWFIASTSRIQHQFAEEVVQLQQKNLEIAEARAKIGQGTVRDVHLASANTASAKEASRTALSAYENSLRSLELILGRYPSAEMKTDEQLVAVPPPIPAGIPSAILERRPDLIAAEHRVAAAFYQQKEAELLHLPRFQFSLGLGINSLTNAVSGLAAGIFAPLYTGGAIEGQVDEATAEQKAAIATYAQAALQAFKEVESGLAAEGHLLKREEYIKIEVSANKTAYEQTLKQYEIGKISLLDVLLIQGKWINARIAELDIASKRLINRVNLHLALGGSFE